MIIYGKDINVDDEDDDINYVEEFSVAFIDMLKDDNKDFTKEQLTILRRALIKTYYDVDNEVQCVLRTYVEHLLSYVALSHSEYQSVVDLDFITRRKLTMILGATNDYVKPVYDKYFSDEYLNAVYPEIRKDTIYHLYCNTPISMEEELPKLVPEVCPYTIDQLQDGGFIMDIIITYLYSDECKKYFNDEY